MTGQTDLDGTAKTSARETWRDAPAAAKALIVGTFLHRLGGFLQIFMVLYLTHRGFSSGQAGIALSLYGGGLSLGVLLGGWLSDRLGPRRTIVGSMALTAVLLPSVLYLDSYLAVVTVIAAIGAVGQAYRPASTSALSQLIPHERHVMTFAMLRLATNLGTGIGPILGAALVAISYDLLFWGEALAVLVFAGVAAVALRGESRPEATARKAGSAPIPAEPAADKRASYLDVLRDRRYLLFLVAIFVTTMVYIQHLATLPLAVVASGLGTTAYGVLVGLNGFIVIAFELLVARRVQHWTPRAATVAGVALTAVGMSVYGLPWGLVGFVLATTIWSFGETVGYPTLFFAYPAQAGPAHLRGRYIGASNSIFGLGFALGPVVGVAVWNALGSALWMWCGIAGLVAVVITAAGVVPKKADAVPKELTGNEV